MSFDAFIKKLSLSAEDICRDIFRTNQEAIKIKKENVATKNLANIFNATLRLSNAKGFHAMSLRDLAKETQLSLGALYAYFSSKEQLLKLIQEQGFRITSQVLEDEIKPFDEPEAKLKAAIRAHLYLSEAMQPWFYFFYMEAKYLSKEDQKRAIGSELFTEQILISILEEGVAAKRFHGDHTVLVAAALKAMLQDWYLKRWKYSRRGVTVDAYADFVFDLVNRYLTDIR